MPASQQWTDLYSTWNMAFVSHYDNFAYVIPKLLIPSVSGYHDNPKGYIYTRSLALYIHLYSRFLAKGEAIQAGVEDPFKWYDVGLTSLWGEVNKESSLDYIEKAEGQ